MKDYKSPIELFESPIDCVLEQIQEQKEGYVFQYLKKIGVNVNKEELMKALQYDRHQYEKGYKDGYDDGCSSDKWISVEDRLPEDNDPEYYQTVILTLKNKKVVTGCYRTLDGEWWGDVIDGEYINITDEVTHWMPLPDAPKDVKLRTDEQIIKADEIIRTLEHAMYSAKGEDGFKELHWEMLKQWLDLINRQKAEIERLHKLQKPTGAGGFKVENGKVVFYSDMLNGYRHEYKDLDEVVKELNLYMHTDYKNIELISHYQHKAKNSKYEAINEFAERLKEKATTHYDWSDYVDVEYIDNLVKEMTEQS